MSDRCEAFPSGSSVAGPDFRPAALAESPSLFTAGDNGPPAYELKFLLPEDLARAVESRLSGQLRLDPHADPALGNAYHTTSLYTDTPGYDVLHRSGALAGQKYRVRRYGTNGPIFAERKTKRGDKVRKLRITVAEQELALLATAEYRSDWSAGWFHQEVVARQLRPVCRVAYERVAYMGATDTGTVRATFDRRVRGVPAIDWDVASVGTAPILLEGRVICEFKFRVALPDLLKSVVQEFGLTPSTVSKYRLFMETVWPEASRRSGPDA